MVELSQIAQKWKDLGSKLNVSSGKLREIKYDHSVGDQLGCLREMLNEWLQDYQCGLSYTRRSWKSVVNAVEAVGETQLAERLRSKYDIPHWL